MSSGYSTFTTCNDVQAQRLAALQAATKKEEEDSGAGGGRGFSAARLAAAAADILRSMALRVGLACLPCLEITFALFPGRRKRRKRKKEEGESLIGGGTVTTTNNHAAAAASGALDKEVDKMRGSVRSDVGTMASVIKHSRELLVTLLQPSKLNPQASGRVLTF